ncbi:MAG: hypothetical protein DLM67_14875 [Candidatus Nephthysia bennettiae]|nr:MAG: hypothetical protein DLM67_14875 [Candidatus Dormibacteraeota bacterium]
MASRIWFLPGWWRLVLLALPLVISAGVLAAVFAFLPSPQAPAARVPPAPSGGAADAGGLTADADPNRMPNLAARLKDGQEVKVPARTAPARGAASSRTTRVSLNAATTDELAAVPGFTADLAEAAVRYRQDYGGFSSMRELVTVLGMGEADYLIARSYLTV